MALLSKNKLAFLTAVPGSGKGYLCNSLDEQGYAVITGDAVVHGTSVRLCPFLKHGAMWNWDFWSPMLSFCDVRSAMRRAVLDYLSKPAKGGGTVRSRIEAGAPIVAEAYLFGIRGLREILIPTLGDVGFEIEDWKVFYMDRPIPEIVEMFNGRVRSGERPLEREKVASDVQVDVDRLVSHLSGIDVTRRSSIESMADALREFLGPPRANSPISTR